jgi:hypothetical protein
MLFDDKAKQLVISFPMAKDDVSESVEGEDA